MPWLHSASGWGGLLKRSRSPHGKQGRDSEPVNATGYIDVEQDRESVGSPSSSARGSVRKDRILATEFLTRQRSNAQPSSSSWAFKAAALGLPVCGVFAPAKAAGAPRVGSTSSSLARRAERRGRVASLCGPKSTGSLIERADFREVKVKLP